MTLILLLCYYRKVKRYWKALQLLDDKASYWSVVNSWDIILMHLMDFLQWTVSLFFCAEWMSFPETEPFRRFDYESFDSGNEGNLLSFLLQSQSITASYWSCETIYFKNENRLLRSGRCYESVATFYPLSNLSSSSGSWELLRETYSICLNCYFEKRSIASALWPALVSVAEIKSLEHLFSHPRMSYY